MMACLAVSSLIGCGQPLADGTYRGDALYEIEGPLLLANVDQLISLAECQATVEACDEAAHTICEERPSGEPELEAECPGAEACYDAFEQCLAGEGADVDVLNSEVELGVSLIWSNPDPGGIFVEQPSTIEPGLPARYRLTVFQPPPDRVLRSATVGRYAVGVLIAYEDFDGDGRIDPTFESVLGGTTELGLLYTPGGVEHPELGSFEAGFHRVVPIDDWCESREGARFVAPDEPVSPITFGRLDEIAPILLPDLDCKDGLSEWGLCPDGAELDRCDERRPPLYCAFCDRDDEDEDDEDDEDEDDR